MISIIKKRLLCLESLSRESWREWAPRPSRHLKVVVGTGGDCASPGLAFACAGAAQELTDSAAR